MFKFAKRNTNKRVEIGPVGPMGPAGPAGKPARYRSPRFTPVTDSAKGKPTRAHDGDAGYDLTLAGTKPVVLTPGGRATVPTGWAVRLDPATCGLVLPRSGNAAKLGLNVITGVIDSGYTGEVKVTVHNTSRDKVTLTPGMRVAQLVVTPVVTHGAPAKNTERGAGGFGSTGTSGDMVNHPPHYTVHPVFTGECHDYAKYMTFDQGNAFKYLWRCAGKGDMAENVRKALWYLNAMRTGPVLTRRGNRLDDDKVSLLEAEVTAALDTHDKDKSPVKLMAALACYSAAACVADGNVTEAVALAKNALNRLNGVK